MVWEGDGGVGDAMGGLGAILEEGRCEGIKVGVAGWWVRRD